MAPLPYSGDIELITDRLEPRMRPCSACDGDGYFIRQYGPGYEAGYGYVPYERPVTCQECQGSGEVPGDEEACPNCAADPLIIYNADCEPYNPHAFICQACGHEWEEAAA